MPVTTVLAQRAGWIGASLVGAGLVMLLFALRLADTIACPQTVNCQYNLRTRQCEMPPCPGPSHTGVAVALATIGGIALVAGLLVLIDSAMRHVLDKWRGRRPTIPSP